MFRGRLIAAPKAAAQAVIAIALTTTALVGGTATAATAATETYEGTYYIENH